MRKEEDTNERRRKQLGWKFERVFFIHDLPFEDANGIWLKRLLKKNFFPTMDETLCESSKNFFRM